MFEEDFRESMYPLLGALTGSGIAIMMTIEITESYSELRFSPHAVSFMTHDIILQRYVEIDGELKTINSYQDSWTPSQLGASPLRDHLGRDRSRGDGPSLRGTDYRCAA